MIVIIDAGKGIVYNFKTRKDAGEFIGVTRPTLRKWLTNPFYLHKTLIITHTSNEKVQQSNRALLKKKVAEFRTDEINRVKGLEVGDVQRIPAHVGSVPINDSRPEQTAVVET